MKAGTCSSQSYLASALRSFLYSSIWLSANGTVCYSSGNLRTTTQHTVWGGFLSVASCKISGMIDESFDTKQMEKAPQPWEFRVKPAWQRLLIMIGGVLVNFLLALFIYSMIMFTWGRNLLQSIRYAYGYAVQ